MKNLITNRYEIAKMVSAGATIVNIIGLLITFNTESVIASYILTLGIMASFVSYIFGGLLTALGIVIKMGFKGLTIAPVPYNLIAALLTMFFATVVFLFLPAIAVYKAALLYE